MIKTNDFYFADHLSNSPLSLFIAAQILRLKTHELCCLLCENSIVFIPNGQTFNGFSASPCDMIPKK